MFVVVFNMRNLIEVLKKKINISWLSELIRINQQLYVYGAIVLL